MGALIDDSAIDHKVDRAKEFIENGDMVRFTVVLKGRQKAHPELAEDKVKKFMRLMEDVAKPEKDKIEKRGGTFSVMMMKK